METLSKFGDRLKWLMNEAEVNQTVLADKTGIDHTSLGRYLKGNCIPTVKNIIILADFFNCSTDYLLGFKEEYSSDKFAQAPQFSTRLLYFIEQSKLSRYSFAHEVHIADSNIYNLCTGAKQPSIDSVIKIAKYLDRSIDYVLGREV